MTIKTKHADVFPAIITITSTGPDTQTTTRKVDRSRVAIVGDRIMVVVDSPTGPQLVYSQEVQEWVRHKDRTYEGTTIKGHHFIIQRDKNCGCGMRLRNWNPFGVIVTSAEDPKE